jgi:5-aminolevulinate synthase
MLLSKHHIYVQSINFPTVARGEERLRITPTPGHTNEQIDHLLASVDAVFTKLNLRRTPDWVAIGGRAGVGMPVEVKPSPIWTDKQLGLEDGSAPSILSAGKQGEVMSDAVKVAEQRLTHLLGQGPAVSDMSSASTTA